MGEETSEFIIFTRIRQKNLIYLIFRKKSNVPSNLTTRQS